MYTIFALLAAFLGLVLWSYIVSYMMYEGVDQNFINKARRGVIRGMIVAGIFVAFQYIPVLSDFIQKDWVLFPAIFFIISLPFSWQRIGGVAILPLLLSFFAWFVLSFSGDSITSFLWSPFHEEIGKWYQSVTLSYPAVMSPFVSLGFGVLENFRYFSYDLTMAQILWRTLFSLPLHIFVGLFAFWVFFSFRNRALGTVGGLIVAIGFHGLYNWSLDVSLLLTLFLIVLGYMFYGWSLENGWWKKSL